MISPWQMTIPEVEGLLCKNGETVKVTKRFHMGDWIAILQLANDGRAIAVSTGESKLLAVQSLLDNIINGILSQSNIIASQKRITNIHGQRMNNG